MASLAKKSLTLPGMQSDWEIDPDELEIARKPDGTEWRLGSGASAHVWTPAPHCSHHNFIYSELLAAAVHLDTS